MENFVTAAVFNYPHEITILKHRLDMEGIVHYFINETLSNVAPMYSLAFGGIKLQVHPADLESVKRILKELDDDPNLRIV